MSVAARFAGLPRSESETWLGMAHATIHGLSLLYYLEHTRRAHVELVCNDMKKGPEELRARRSL